MVMSATHNASAMEDEADEEEDDAALVIGDTFNGTYEALRRLYPLVIPGGVVYVDDAGAYRGAAVALREYLGWPIGTRILEQAVGEQPFYEAVWWRKGIEKETLEF